MTNQPHTPTATQIREDYAHLRYHFADGWSVGEERVQFDNWLTAQIAAAEQRGAIKALRGAAHSPRLADAVQYAIKHDSYASAARRSFENYLLQEANRADQEGDE